MLNSLDNSEFRSFWLASKQRSFIFKYFSTIAHTDNEKLVITDEILRNMTLQSEELDKLIWND